VISGSGSHTPWSAQDVADIIAFAVGRPRTVALNEILIRPAGQAG
jgi:NADP-dependent 3-hydroxy acid dehydrogenase YdfG